MYLSKMPLTLLGILVLPTHTEDTPYVDGTFHVKLVLSQDFPNSPPRGYFLTRIYHPNVSSAGDICVNTLKRDWSPSVTLAHVLQVIRCLLIVPFPESSLNDEAGKQFMESYADYARRARLLTSVHARRKVNGSSENMIRSASRDSMSLEKEVKLVEGEDAADGFSKKSVEESMGEGETKGVLGSPNLPGLMKRKGDPNQKEAASSMDKRLKKKGLKRL